MQTTTKGDLVIAALRKIAVVSDATLTDIEPQSLEDAVIELEFMMNEWYEEGNGIRIGYIFSQENTPIEQDEEHGINKNAINAVIYNLATRIAPDYQIQPLEKVIMTARYGKELLRRHCSIKRARKARSHYPNGFPVGSGNRFATANGYRYFHRINKNAKDTDPNC